MKNIRNFCIIAHIDHGKSTLSDRLLEMTGTIEKRQMKEQLLDTMDLERERGITIKMTPVQMRYKISKSRISDFSSTHSSLEKPTFSASADRRDDKKEDYVLNLIDTPGHVDFAYEVSRSLAAVEGAILLVDATQGVQAQTISNLYQAIEQGLEIIPVVNKIDLPNAEVAKTKKEIIHILGGEEKDILEVSAKTGKGVDKLLETIIEKIPAPQGDKKAPLRALIFDSVYDEYKGVLAYVRIVDGEISAGDKLQMMMTKGESNVVEVGHFTPQYQADKKLSAGDIGYIATGFKSVKECKVGDTITVSYVVMRSRTNIGSEIEPLPGYAEVRPMMYASFYPNEGDDYNEMREALEKLTLNDSAFTFEPESNLALGRGFRCGFLGMLHLEIIQARLEREFKISPVVTTPSVVYKVKLKKTKSSNNVIDIYSPLEMPNPSQIESIEEPVAKLEIVTPSEYLGKIMDLMNQTRANYKKTDYIDQSRLQLTFEAPLMDIITDFYDQLKSVSSGYASMNYEFLAYRSADLIKLDILVAEEKVEAFSRIVPREKAYAEGKRIVTKLKEILPRQNFAVALQASLGGKVIARETIKAFRKDVTAKLYGGDVTRKRKLLEKQKKGKKRMAQRGRVEIPSQAFLKVLQK